MSYLCFVFSALLNGLWDGLVLNFMAGGGFLLLLFVVGGVRGRGLAFTVFGDSPCDIVGYVCRSLLLLDL